MQGFNVPNLFGVLIDTAVAAEEAHPSYARDRLGDPVLLVLVRLVDQRVCFDVAVKIVRHKVVITMVPDSRDERFEIRRCAEGALLDFGEDRNQVWVKGMSAVRVRVTEILDILGKVSEQKDVVLPNLPGNLDLNSGVSIMDHLWWTGCTKIKPN